MRNYTNPDIDILWFDEEDILTASDVQNTKGYTAAMDVMSQMENVSGSNMSVSTVRIEDINIQ